MTATLTPSQREALRILAAAGDAVTYSSNKNGPSYIAAGSGAVLVERGLAENVAGRRGLDFCRFRITPAGLEVAA